MKAAGVQGVIINVTSAAGLRGGLSPADYAASKAGVVALTQQAACEFAGHGIRVNSVAPAYVSTVRPSFLSCHPSSSSACRHLLSQPLEKNSPTALGNTVQPMTSAILGGAPAADVEQQLGELSSFKGHTAAAEDVANAIAFLASSEAAAITGANLLIDTGLLTGIGGKPAFGTLPAAAGSSHASDAR